MHPLVAITTAGTAMSALGYLTFAAMAHGATDTLRNSEDHA
ncbi:hypothetical protein ACWDOP_28635 [Nocardia sp. NPDC003693]